jgi:hypothetical protein
MGKKRTPSPYTARTADKYELYQLSVQSPEPDIAFLRRVYKQARARPARHFREDFCGTALLTSEWIRGCKSCTAEGFDIDPEPLGWGRKHNLGPLGNASSRATLHEADVREPSQQPPDVRCAQNFSYWIFTQRSELLDYFHGVRADLAEEGLFVLDIHGGPECMEELEEETEHEEGFSYIWDQSEFSPVTHATKCYIHFRFPDGTEMKNAFRYNWRLWSLPELRDVLTDAGFDRVDVYWEGTAEDGESGNGIYRKTRLGENDISWVSYIVALK